MKKIAIVWHRKCLRIHDNQPLYHAIQLAKKGEVDSIMPIFILDPIFLKRPFNANRFQFLLECLRDLKLSLQKRDSDLFYYHMDTLQCFTELKECYQITDLFFELDSSAFAQQRDKQIKDWALKNKIKVHTYIGHTLTDPWQISNGQIITKFEKFISLLEKSKINEPVLLPDNIGYLPDIEPFDIDQLFDLDRHLDADQHGIVQGGEQLALQRLHAIKKDFIVSFSKPETDPTKYSTTILSPYFALGCLSVRLVYHEWRQIKTDHKPPTSLLAQLYWREFFYCAGALTPNYGKVVGNPIAKQIKWHKNDKFLEAWRAAQTGFPWIDAVMTQLRQEGWIHHLARHAVACFLTRGQLFISWEEGVKVFDEMLLDGDTSVNIGNWLWVSASAFFYQYFRVYSPITFAQKYDRAGLYIKKYLPVLKDVPAEYIYSPWLAPIAVLNKAKVKLGVDYPYPIVDAEESRKKNMEEWKNY